MGKTTLYHPVSLHVIRGAAEYCGWKFGKIEQEFSDGERLRAQYKAIIERSPLDLKDVPYKSIVKQLQHCFMDDIKVTHVSWSKKGVWYVILTVQLKPAIEEHGDTLYGQSEYGDIRVVP